MQILLSKRIALETLTNEIKQETKFLWFPIIEYFPTRLLWLEWVTYSYHKDIKGKWMRTSAEFHGTTDPRRDMA